MALLLRFPSSSSSLLPSKFIGIKSQNVCRNLTNSFTRFKSSWQELAGVLIFSAIPFSAVKAIANSPLGEALQRRMEERKKIEVGNSSKFKALAQKASKDRYPCQLSFSYHPTTIDVFDGLHFVQEMIMRSLWYGEERPRWLGPIPYEYPDYLAGELHGDYVFDVAGLSKDPVALQKFFNFEILHARWAMLAALGAVIPELLNLLGAFNFVEPVWWRVGYSKLQGETLDYLGIPGLHLAGSQGVIVIAICQVLLMVMVPSFGLS